MPRKGTQKLGLKRFWFQNNSESKKFWIKEFFCYPKYFGSQKCSDPKLFGREYFVLTWTNQTCLSPTCPYHTYQIFADKKMIGYINLTRHPLHTSSKYLPVTYQTLIETYPRQPADTLRSFSRHPPDTQETPSKHSPDTLKIPPIYLLHLCVKKRWAAGGWFHDNNATLWLHLESWTLPDFQLSWKSNMERSVAKLKILSVKRLLSVRV